MIIQDLAPYPDDFLPCVMLGFELHGMAEQRLSALGELPEWFSIVSGHQVGGYACDHRSVAGVVLRLSENRVFLRDPDRLLRGLWAMGGDRSQGPPERDLGRLSFTSGKAYSAEELARLSAFLAECGNFPPVFAGREAMVALEDREPLRYFNAWRMCWPKDMQSTPSGDAKPATEEWPMDHCFSQDHLDQLEIIHGLLEEALQEDRWEGGFDRAIPGCFLLWLNSD